MLADAAASDKTRDRSDAISALTILDSDPRAISLIAQALTDKEEHIRLLAASSLGEMKARAAIPALKKALDDKSVQVSFAAAQALWKLGDRSGRDIFYQVLDGERKTNPGVLRSKVNDAKHDMGDPKALALLGVNEVSGTFLGPFSMGISLIEDYAKNTGAPAQALCAKLLASDHTRRTFNELEDALADKNWSIRAAAARALAQFGDVKVLPRLKDMMENDKEQPARLTAAAAVLRLSGTRHKPAAASVPPAAPANSPGGSPKKSTWLFEPCLLRLARVQASV